MDPFESPLILPSSSTQETPGGAIPLPRTQVDLPWPTVAKAIFVLVSTTIVAHLLGVLTPILLQLLVALLLTAALTPPVNWLIRRGVPRAGAVAIVMVAILGLVAGLIALIAPSIASEGRTLARALPGYVDRSQGILKHYPSLDKRLRDAASSGAADPSALVPFVLTAGRGVVTIVTDTIAVIVMSAYLLAGGERSLSYAVGHLPSRFQTKIRRAVPDVVRVVSGYMIGQAITSLIFAIFAFVLLKAMGVPQPLLLAVLAGILDALPIIGVLIATALPALLALTVSQSTALIVVIAYVVYHQLESHVLVPRIYGRTLGISSLAVLVAVLIGYRVLGILGVLIALPLAAAIPAVERAWRQEDLLFGTPADRSNWNGAGDMT